MVDLLRHTQSRAFIKAAGSIGLSDKLRDVHESGPPESLVQIFSTLFAQKIQDTRLAAQQAKERLGW